MKNFLKIFVSSCLGVFAGLCILIFVGISVISAGVSAMMSSDKASTKINPNTVLKIDMNNLPETVVTSPLDDIIGNLSEEDDKPVTLSEVIQAIRKAKENPNIKGIYINTPYVLGGLSAVNAVRRELIDFKKSGKFIVAYSDAFTESGYLLSSVADKIILNPEGTINLVGLALPSMMFHSAMQKLGVQMQVFKVGKFKGAVEPYVLDKLSDSNRLQLQELVDGLWDNITTEISSARSIDKASLISFVNRGGAFDDAKSFVNMHLVDTLAYRTDVENIVSTYMPDKTDDIRMTTVAKMRNVEFQNKPKGDKVYVLYAEGEIVPESTQNDFSSNSVITEKLVDKIEALKDSTDIKAVVIRVNSPGGSAFVSDQIWKAIKDLREDKPVVVSMGHLAASGGYYISSAAERIVAEPNTITGSIGIFGMIPDAHELANKLGISVDVVKTSPFANMNMTTAGISSLVNPLSPEEKSLIQAQVERGYHTFLSRVAEGRNMTTQQVDSIGQGRVWLGAKALKLGLVDELGGVDTAIKTAAKLAKLKEYQAVYEQSRVAKLSELFLQEVDNASDRFKAQVLGQPDAKVLDKIRKVYMRSGLQAVMPYDIQY